MPAGLNKCKNEGYRFKKKEKENEKEITKYRFMHRNGFHHADRMR